VRTWRWRIAAAGAPVPRGWALPVADAAFEALTATAWTLRGSRRLPLCLHGPHAPEQHGWNHEHAFVLPEDEDGDGLIDHLSVTAAMGLDPATLRLLVATDRLMLWNGVAVELVPERMGAFDAAGHHGPARGWISLTAYVPPNPRGAFNPKDAAKQLRNEIGRRCLPAPLCASPQHVPHLDAGGRRIEAASFKLRAGDGEGPPRGAEPAFFALEFEAPVCGPLAFGWLCHRGLGQFAPLPEGASLAGGRGTISSS
jgi:CRISPR-associated protein Csb2